jgi:hypothetical protein
MRLPVPQGPKRPRCALRQLLIVLSAWLLTLTLDAGRFFNYPAGGWTFATVPGVEASCGPVTLNASFSYDRQGYFARDVSVTLAKDISERLNISVTAARFDYPGYTPDHTANVSLRWRIR